MKYKYAFGLLGNAHAFIESAVEYASQNRWELWKFAVVHLTTALELLMKARLALEDHQHLVSGNSSVTDRQFDEGEFRSIGVEDCIERLTELTSFSLSDRQRRVLSTLRSLRNRVTHYICPSDSVALRAAVAAGLNLFVEINHAEFQDDDPYGAGRIPRFVQELHRYEDFVKVRLRSLSERLSTALRPQNHTDECCQCRQDAAVIDDGDIHCLFCGHRIKVRDLAGLMSDDRSVEVCSSCGRQSVFMHRWKDRPPIHECFCCGFVCSTTATETTAGDRDKVGSLPVNASLR